MRTSTALARPAAGVGDIRPLEPGDGLEVRRLFRATIGLRRPHAIEYADLVGYEQLCIDWYLTAGRDQARVVEHDGEIVGYVLVCLNQPAYAAWARGRTVRWAGRAASRLATGRLGADARRFVASNMGDVRMAQRLLAHGRFPAHAHVHVAADVRDEGIGDRLVRTVDEVVRMAGLDGWYADVDVPAGGSLGAVGRDGARVVASVPSRTASWAHGAAIRRVRVARSSADRPAFPARNAAAR